MIKSVKAAKELFYSFIFNRHLKGLNEYLRKLSEEELNRFGFKKSFSFYDGLHRKDFSVPSISEESFTVFFISSRPGSGM